MTLLLTGASGFVGRVVLKTALLHGLKIRPVYRSIDLANEHPKAILISNIDGDTNWSQALKGVDVVIHTAARAHIMRENALNPLAEYRRVNVEGTMNLARQAASLGVRRFVFISSIKVNGEATAQGRPFTADDVPAPEDPYAFSKAEAEAELKLLSLEMGMEVTIIRPPLIYGPGVKGNIATLISLVKRGIPLPLGGVSSNRRSFVGIDNLVNLIMICANHPKAANQIFLISDGEDLSTAELILKIGKALGRSVRLLWVPPRLISFVTGLIGQKAISQRLLDSLQVDINKTLEMLDWKPTVTVDEGLRSAVERKKC